ncbi:hypothetical protein CR513_38897, partial [Mucuna pruriens]
MQTPSPNVSRTSEPQTRGGRIPPLLHEPESHLQLNDHGVEAKHAITSHKKENKTTSHSTNTKGKEQEQRRPKYKVFTPFPLPHPPTPTTSRATLLEEIFNIELPLRRMPQATNKTKYCRYH